VAPSGATMADRPTTHRTGILSGPIEDGAWRRRAPVPEVEASPGLRVTHLGSRFSGAVVGVEHEGGLVVRVRSLNTGMERLFQLQPAAFRVEGRTVTLIRPRPERPAPSKSRTASGSTAVPGVRARVARAGRILVEGVHDAELVEKVWGDDLRVEGVVVERLDGVDDLAGYVRRFGPGADARLGVLVDHLVDGSKEWRLAREAAGPHVLVTGHPFVDVWQAIRPGVVGLRAWPEVPRGRPWKEGICEALGDPVPGRLWKRLLGAVRTYADLEPALVGAVESLIDFVTASA
jgi:hypothetical protein